MSDTSMLRVSSTLKAKLKAKADKEGRTLQWVADDALSTYLSSIPTTPQAIGRSFEQKFKELHEPTYEPMDDVA